MLHMASGVLLTLSDDRPLSHLYRAQGFESKRPETTVAVLEADLEAVSSCEQVKGAAPLHISCLTCFAKSHSIEFLRPSCKLKDRPIAP